MLDRVVVVDVPGSVDAGGVTVAAAPGEVSPNGVLSDWALPDGVLSNGVSPVGVLSDGVLPDVVLSDGISPNGVSPDGVSPDGVSPSAVIAARAEADVGFPDGGVAPGGGPVLLRLRRLPVFLLTSGPLARCRGGRSVQENTLVSRLVTALAHPLTPTRSSTKPAV